MKVILTQDVKGQGKKDDVIEVSDGYARNFLIKNKLAVEATSAMVNSIKIKKRLTSTEERKKKPPRSSSRRRFRALPSPSRSRSAKRANFSARSIRKPLRTRSKKRVTTSTAKRSCSPT